MLNTTDKTISEAVGDSSAGGKQDPSKEIKQSEGWENEQIAEHAALPDRHPSVLFETLLALGRVLDVATAEQRAHSHESKELELVIQFIRQQKVNAQS